MPSDGLIRIKGRLVNSDLNFEERHQVLLPRNNELTRRIIEYEHNAHAATQTTMATVK